MSKKTDHRFEVFKVRDLSPLHFRVLGKSRIIEFLEQIVCQVGCLTFETDTISTIQTTIGREICVSHFSPSQKIIRWASMKYGESFSCLCKFSSTLTLFNPFVAKGFRLFKDKLQLINVNPQIKVAPRPVLLRVSEPCHLQKGAVRDSRRHRHGNHALAEACGNANCFCRPVKGLVAA